MDILIDIEGYIGEGINYVLKDTEASKLSETTRNQLQTLVTYLSVDTVDLMQNTGPVRDVFNSIKNDLPLEVCEALQPTVCIDYHEQELLKAMRRLEARDA